MFRSSSIREKDMYHFVSNTTEKGRYYQVDVYADSQEEANALRDQFLRIYCQIEGKLTPSEIADIQVRPGNKKIYDKNHAQHATEIALLLSTPPTEFTCIVYQGDSKKNNLYTYRAFNDDSAGMGIVDVAANDVVAEFYLKQSDFVLYPLPEISVSDDKQKKNEELEEVRNASRVFAQGYRDENSLFSTIPIEVLQKIAGHVADPKVVKEDEAHQTAIRNFNRPTAKKKP